jgi:hypothetical protein
VPADNARDLPDVSLFASNGFLDSFYVICQSDRVGGTCDLSNLQGYGGTSVASPAFAGIMALVNQKWGLQGNANLVLYNLASKQPTAFHDVPSGSTNAVPCRKDTPNCTTNVDTDTYGVLKGYSTTTNYDLATGLGSVDANNLVTNWNNVTFIPTTTALTLSVPANTTHGTAVPVTVRVTSNSATGDVALLVNPKPGTHGIDEFKLTNGAFTGTTSMLPGGTYQVIAHYEGDTTYGGSYSTPTANVTVNPENSSVYMPGLVTGTDGNGNPVYSISVLYASHYLLRTDVQNAHGKFCDPLNGSACPTGTVFFTDNGNPLDGGTYALNSYGYTEDQTLQLQGGTHTLVAQYRGDSSFNVSSTSVQVTVTPLSTSLGTLYVSNPAAGIQPYVSVYVNTTSNGAAPTGIVTFYANGTPMTGPVAYTLYNGNNQFYANLQAIINTTVSPFPVPGAYTISASYSGDSNYSASTITGQTVNVKFPSPGMLLASSSYSVVPGSSITLTTTVGGFSKSIAPTGTISISGSEGQIPGTISYTTVTDRNSGYLDLQGSIAFTPTFTDYYSTQYSGDSNFPNNQTFSSRVDVTGSDFTLWFPPQTTMTVVVGSYGQLNNLLVGMQTDTAPVTFSVTPCTGLPAESMCSVGPSVSYTSTIQVNVTTTAPHQVASNRAADGGTPGIWAMFLGLGIASILVIGGPRHRSTLLAIALCAFLVGGFGCGGGGNNSGGGGGGGHTDPGTPPGTYTITVTGTRGSTTHTATFTLKVQ